MENKLRGPNFDLIEYENVSSPGEFKSWDELLGTDTQSAQQILDSQLGSESVTLNIDYSRFENFIHYSSAVERVKNFKYKLELIESYTSRINELRSSNSISPILLKSNLNDLYSKRNKIVSGFDNFEKYLFFGTDTGSKYSHMGQVDINPWPKTSIVGESLRWSEVYLNWQSWASEWSNGTDLDPYAYFSILSPVDSDASITYYESLLTLATIYDRNNIHALDKTIPRYLVELSDNAEYILFINMIGQHFDIQWSYIKYMSTIHTREEHPLDGMPADLLQSVASGLGFELLNGRSTSELWDYILDSGDRKSDSSVIKQIWRRIVNNLPEVLKSKGTARSIKALLSCYGIPSSALTIKEYGGPQVTSDSNIYNSKDVFHYAWPINWTSGSLQQNIPIEIQELDTYGRDRILSFRFRLDPTYDYITDTDYILLSSGGGQYGYGVTVYLKYNSDTTFTLYYSSIINPAAAAIENIDVQLGEWYLISFSISNNTADMGASSVINCEALVYDKDNQYHIEYSQLPYFPEDIYYTPVSNIPSSVFDINSKESIISGDYIPYINGTELYVSRSAPVLSTGSLCTIYPAYGTTSEPIGLLYISGSVYDTDGPNSIVRYTISAETTSRSYYDGVSIGDVIQWAGKCEIDSMTGSLLPISRWTTNVYNQSNSVTLIFDPENTGSSNIPTAFISSSIPYEQSSDIQRYIPLFAPDSGLLKPVIAAFRVGAWTNIGGTDPISGLRDPLALGADIYNASQVMISLGRSKYGKLIESYENEVYDTISVLQPTIRSYTLSSPTSSILNQGIEATTLNTGSPGTDGYIIYGFPDVPAHIYDIRHYIGTYDQATFNSHVRFPGLYYGYGSSSYESLIQRYPLTSNNIEVTSSILYNRNINSIILSSQPNKQLYDRPLYIIADSEVVPTFSAFEDTWYYKRSNVGGISDISDKIRIEDIELDPNSILNIDTSIQRSSFDKYSIDSNRVGVYFSPQDSINSDILNQFGDINLDQYIGDPGDLNKLEYTELQTFSRDYWKKYQAPVDFESYFRALSVYDFTIFTYIKRLLPARVRAVTGLVIEPNILQRSKSRLYRGTSISNLFYTGSIYPDASELTSTVSNITAYLSGSIPISSVAQRSYQGIINDISDIDRLGNVWNQNRFIGKYKVVESGSYIPLQLFVSGSRLNIQFSEVRYLYSTAVSASLNLPDSEYYVISQFSDDRSTGILNSRYRGAKLTAAAINVPSVNTFDGGPVVSSVRVDPNQITYNNGELIIG